MPSQIFQNATWAGKQNVATSKVFDIIFKSSGIRCQQCGN